MERSISRDSLEPECQQSNANLNRYFRQDSEFIISNNEETKERVDNSKHVVTNNEVPFKTSESYRSQTLTDRKISHRHSVDKKLLSKSLSDDRTRISYTSFPPVDIQEYTNEPGDINKVHLGVGHSQDVPCRYKDIDCEFVHFHSFGCGEYKCTETNNVQHDDLEKHDMEIENKRLMCLSRLEDSIKTAENVFEQNRLFIERNGHSRIFEQDSEINEDDFVMIPDKVSVLQTHHIDIKQNFQCQNKTDIKSRFTPKSWLSSRFLSRTISAGKFPYKDYSCISEFPCSRRRICGIAAKNGNVFAANIDSTNIKVFDYQGNAIDNIDAKAEVDDLAISDDYKLYISCPVEKMIKVLNSNLEMRVVMKTSLHVRGLAIDPVDNSIIACMTSSLTFRQLTSQGISKENYLARFPTALMHPKGRRVNRYNCFCYPVRVSINNQRQLLVSDEGLRCVFVLNFEGLISARIDYAANGPRQLLERHVLMCTPKDDVIAVQGGTQNIRVLKLDGNPIITKHAMQMHEIEAQSVRAGTVDGNGLVIVGTETGVIKIFKLLNV